MIGNKIADARKRKGWSQRKLAEVTDMDAGHIGKIEAGRRTPSPRIMKKIADALDVPVDYLIEAEEIFSEAKYKQLLEKASTYPLKRRKALFFILDAFEDVANVEKVLTK